MAQIIYTNPNYPEQPIKGVYRWFYFDKNNKEITFYVGSAGNREPRSSRKPSTLARGLSEAQRSCLSSDGGITLDTDFVVGTAIIFLKEKGFNCLWQHITNNPKDEITICERYKPLLQDEKGYVQKCFKCKIKINDKIEDAQGELFTLFKKKLVFTCNY